ncbi:MAG: hypothetical protein A2X28_04605 [Elusimicrobia bacterium GWA2_56_46]|nr:MAG: hypothetical protein A2X28_04605 [Elusimicrobia bacterium GWA2_56_46]OGR56156.1 MAG: hypothetical protein A2X39_08025 [Elusimicrobia bacterium GWC2_56_31]HBW23071.1 hypothetical protein [Elusimicrobiota bacterium]
MKEEKELEEAARALTESEERYRDLFERTSDLIFTVSPEGRVLYANLAVRHTLGYGQEELLATPFFDLLSLSCREAAMEYFRRTAAGGKSGEQELVFRTRGGGEVITEGCCHLKEKEGKPLYLQGIFRDVTKHRELEKRFFQAQKMEAIGRLAGGIAHDFNNILSAIEGYSTLILKNMPETDPARPDIEEIRKAEQRGAALTKQLMTFSRRTTSNKKAVNLNELTRDLEKMAKRLLGDNVALEVAASPDLKPVQANPGQLEQVLMNLLVNARDAMPGGGRIKVNIANADLTKTAPRCPSPAEPGQEFILISVADSGSGMSADTLNRLFEPFFTTKPKGKGTGLGLSTVYSIVKQHNGWIDVQSEEGKGSVFNIYLPRAAAEAPGVTNPPEAVRNLRGNGEKVLVVEDDEALRKLTARILKENGYAPTEAGTAAEASGIFSVKDSGFSVVFADIMLGDRNGTELIDEFKKTAPKTAFVFTSGFLDDMNELELIKTRGCRFIQKPYSIESVLKTFKELLAPEKTS